MVGILTNHSEYPDPTCKISARVLLALDEDDPGGLSAALDCLRVITSAKTRNEAMEIAEDKGRPWSERVPKPRKRKR